jgi:hypothetical protein
MKNEGNKNLIVGRNINRDGQNRKLDRFQRQRLVRSAYMKNAVANFLKEEEGGREERLKRMRKELEERLHTDFNKTRSMFIVRILLLLLLLLLLLFIIIIIFGKRFAVKKATFRKQIGWDTPRAVHSSKRKTRKLPPTNQCI